MNPNTLFSAQRRQATGSKTPDPAQANVLHQNPTCPVHIAQSMSKTGLIKRATCMAFTLAVASASADPAPTVTITLPEPDPSGCEVKEDTPIFCPDNQSIEIQYLNSDNPVANRVINSAINTYISPDLAARTQSANAIPSEADYYQTIAQYARENSTSYSAANIGLHIEKLPPYCQLEQYAVSIEFYSGGASPGSNQWTFAFEGEQQLTPDKLFIADKRIELERLIEDALYRYTSEDFADDDRPDFGIPRRERVEISPYLYLTADGVHLQYQKYELMPGNYGEPNLILPWQWLDGIVNPRYMPERCR